MWDVTWGARPQPGLPVTHSLLPFFPRHSCPNLLGPTESGFTWFGEVGKQKRKPRTNHVQGWAKVLFPGLVIFFTAVTCHFCGSASTCLQHSCNLGMVIEHLAVLFGFKRSHSFPLLSIRGQQSAQWSISRLSSELIETCWTIQKKAKNLEELCSNFYSVSAYDEKFMAVNCNLQMKINIVFIWKLADICPHPRSAFSSTRNWLMVLRYQGPF